MTEDTHTKFLTDRDEDTFGGEDVAVGTPATTLVLGYLAVTVLVGGFVGTYLYSNPELFGEQGYARLAGLVVLALTVVGLVRLAIKYVVLHRTQYVVTSDSVRRQYRLAYREQSRELPLHMIRGVELSRSRTQALLGYGTISFLAVGSNRGIGYVEFDNAAEPERLQSAVLELLEKQRADAQGDGANAAGGRRQAASANAATADSASTSADGTESAPASTVTDADSAPNDSGDAFEDDPLSDAGDDARRPVSGNDDSRQSAEPDARDD
ncbi:PH domain-containing protein [Halorubellus sp. JP-L1]|uniref:PH domain-containing protein n=1 Tax=Halorubellus sp. JP-L1 TaxID=2715753 RepID=UPI00140C22AA|nr:PH domain-containing protein [Halorubellus sp. JP-L1]NHN42487.1 PH domain-containing protein [Halorubellus sp. JP-L1]